MVGLIELVGGAVANFRKGDRVAVGTLRHCCNKCGFCKCKRTNLCDERVFTYGEHFGGYATHIQIEADWVFALPANLTKLETVPPLMCAGITMFSPLKRYRRVGAKVAILGIGGLGHLGIQFASKMGMHVTAFTTKVNNPAPLKALGAEEVCHSTDLAALKAQRGKFDLVISTIFVGQPELYKAHQHLTARNGVYVVIGVPNVKDEFQIDTDYVVEQEIMVAGSVTGSIADTQEMLRFAADFGVESINEYFEFEDFNKALHHTEHENPHFRSVINVSRFTAANNLDK